MGMDVSQKRGEVTAAINVVPMADIMLVLLIIFMVVTPMLQSGITVEMAQTRNPNDMHEADRDEAVVVAVTRDGFFFIGQERVNIEDLAVRVGDKLVNRLDKTVYIRSDYRAKYGSVVQVVDTIRSAGVDRVGLLTERIDDQVRQ